MLRPVCFISPNTPGSLVCQYAFHFGFWDVRDAVGSTMAVCEWVNQEFLFACGREAGKIAFEHYLYCVIHKSGASCEFPVEE